MSKEMNRFNFNELCAEVMGYEMMEVNGSYSFRPKHENFQYWWFNCDPFNDYYYLVLVATKLMKERSENLLLSAEGGSVISQFRKFIWKQSEIKAGEQG